MTATAFRYEFGERVEIPEVEASLLLALWATESLHGESLCRLEAGYALDADHRACVVDAESQAGKDLNRIFVGFLEREFGADAFRVERCSEQSADFVGITTTGAEAPQ